MLVPLTMALGSVAEVRHIGLVRGGRGRALGRRNDVFRRAAFCAAAAAFSVFPARAEPAPTINYTTYSDEQLAVELETALKSESPDWCGVLEPLTRQMETRGTFDRRVGVLAVYSDMVCAYEEERWADAYQLMGVVERRMGRPLDFPMSILILQRAGHDEVAKDRFLAFVDAAAAKGVTREQSLFVWDFARSYAKAKQPERRLALFRELLKPERREKFDMLTVEGMASQLFKWEVEAGNIDAARALLPELTSPITVLSTLGDRRFAALWPDIEARAGKNMATVINALVDQRKSWFDADRENDEALKELAEAYVYAGRFDDAVALVSSREPAADAYGALTEDMAWALSAKIRALDATGRRADADAIYERMASVDPGDGKGWIVNFVINRAIRLVGIGENERGLIATDMAGKIAENHGNDYARALVRRTRICALAGLGRNDEAKALLAEAVAHSDDSRSSAVQAMLCVGANDEAAKAANAMLADSVQAGEMIEDMQPADFSLYSNESVLPNAETRLRRRPDVASQFLKVARDIPRDFVPLFSLRRAERRAATP